MDDLEVLREKVDKVNGDLLELLNLRTALVDAIIKHKDRLNVDYYDPVRENEMLKEILSHNKGPLSNELVRDIFSCIFKATLLYMGLSRERKLLVGSSAGKRFKTVHEMFDIPSGLPVIIAGPCAIENAGYLDSIAGTLAKYNIKLLRGGAYKPRTSPYEFQGLKEEGLKILGEVSGKYHLHSVTEVVDTRDVELVARYADVLQIGARNMQNYELLKEAGQTRKPIILKRGMSATIEEFILAAEYIALQGNENIILCERGIRSFERKTRNTLDISCVPVIKKETTLPIIVDLSHSLGRKDIIVPVAKAVLAAAADGIMVEVHPEPEYALSDSKQQLNIGEFMRLMDCIGIRGMK